MDATTKDRAVCSSPTPLTTAGLKDGKIVLAGQDATFGRMSDHMARVAECVVQGGTPYQAGGRGMHGEGVDGFGFLRLCAMAATGRQLGDLFGYIGWPQEEPRDTRVANMLEDWGLTQVGGYEVREFQRGDVLVYVGPGPTGEIVVSPGNQDRAAVTASCWAPDAPRIAPIRASLQRHMVRVYRWVEA